MTLQEIKKNFQEELKGIFSSEEIDMFFFMIVQKEFGFSKSKTLASLKEEVSMGESIMIHGCLNRLKKSEPIQYILEETEFYGLPFKVSPYVLIPRPETEELVDWVVQEYKNHKSESLELLDIGTGSGCIAVSLAKKLHWANISALDVSKKALGVAEENAQHNQVETDFFERDILQADSLPKSYDVIISNPPYVRESEKKAMQKNVLNYEPHTALYVDDEDPLRYYQKIAHLAKKHLTSGGALYFEINEYLSEELIELLQNEGFKRCILKQDLFGKDRMLKCSLDE